MPYIKEGDLNKWNPRQPEKSAVKMLDLGYRSVDAYRQTNALAHHLINHPPADRSEQSYLAAILFGESTKNTAALMTHRGFYFRHTAAYSLTFGRMQDVYYPIGLSANELGRIERHLKDVGAVSVREPDPFLAVVGGGPYLMNYWARDVLGRKKFGRLAQLSVVDLWLLDALRREGVWDPAACTPVTVGNVLKRLDGTLLGPEGMRLVGRFLNEHCEGNTAHTLLEFQDLLQKGIRDCYRATRDNYALWRKRMFDLSRDQRRPIRPYREVAAGGLAEVIPFEAAGMHDDPKKKTLRTVDDARSLSGPFALEAYEEGRTQGEAKEWIEAVLVPLQKEGLEELRRIAEEDEGDPDGATQRFLDRHAELDRIEELERSQREPDPSNADEERNTPTARTADPDDET